MATETEIYAAGTRVYNDAEALVAEARTIKADTAPLVVQAKQDRDAAERAYIDTKGLADSIGGSSAKTVIALLQLSEGDVGSRPARWLNSVAGGPAFNNWGSAKIGGGSRIDNAPFGAGMGAQAADGNLCAISSETQVTFGGDFTIESILVGLDQGRNLMQFSSNGTDSGDMRILVGCRVDGDDGTNRMVCFAKKGSLSFEAFYTPPLVPMTIGGQAGAYHFALQRESGILTFRCNGAKISTAGQALSGGLTGYVDPFGSYARVWDGAEGMYQSRVAVCRVTNGAVYAGNSYTVPTARLTTSV